MYCQEIKSNLKFAQSLEEVRASEKKLKEAKAKSARKKHYEQARAKCGLGATDTFYKHHVKMLTVAQIKAVCYIEFGGLIIKGKAAELKMKLTSLLEDASEDASEDGDDDSVSGDDGVPDEVSHIDIPFKDMFECVDECVEVWWKGDKCWYKGRLLSVDKEARTFEVFYFVDKQTLTHNEDEYKVRQAC